MPMPREGKLLRTRQVPHRPRHAPSGYYAVCMSLSEVVATRRTSAPQQVHDQPGRRDDVTPDTLPDQSATTPGPGRSMERKRSWSAQSCCALVVQGWRARGRVSLSTTWCLKQTTDASREQASEERADTSHKRSMQQQTSALVCARGRGAAVGTSSVQEKCRSCCAAKQTNQSSTAPQEARSSAAPQEAITHLQDGWGASVAARTVNTT